MLISTSILSIKNNIKANLNKLNNTTTDFIHLDIMDGKFVSNKTWSIDNIKTVLIDNKKPLDVHLMVKDVIKYIDDYSALKPEYITFHLEACNDIAMVIDCIHKHGVKAGLSIKPTTDIKKLIPYLNTVDMVLLMSVEPGKGGQTFMASTYERLNELANLKKEYNFLIEIDGGINDIIISRLSHVDIAVVGSYITNSDNYQLQIDKLKKSYFKQSE